MPRSHRILTALLTLGALAVSGPVAAQGAQTAIGGGLGAAAGTAIGDTLGGSTGASVGGAAGAVVGAGVTRQQSPGVVGTSARAREVILVERKPGKRKGHSFEHRGRGR